MTQQERLKKIFEENAEIDYQCDVEQQMSVETFIRVASELLEEREPFKGFWNRLEMFVSNVQVNDMMSEEEKGMILSVCKQHKTLITNNIKD